MNVLTRGNRFLSTLSLRRATLFNLILALCPMISIHALLAESDVHYDNYNLHCVEISIHALLAESDRTDHIKRNKKVKFLSTLSLRRATISCARSASKLADFYPRSPCGERPICKRQIIPVKQISIHALLAESDFRLQTDFSCLPIISIHALLAESDACPFLTFEICVLFLSTLSLRRATA